MAFPLRMFQLDAVAFIQGHKRAHRYDKHRTDRARLMFLTVGGLGGGYLGAFARPMLIAFECGFPGKPLQPYAKPRG